MPPVCTICSHEKRHEIDRCVANGEAIRNIAKRFGVGPASLDRHVHNGHIDKKIETAKYNKTIKEGQTLYDRIQEVRRLGLEGAMLAKEQGDLRAYAQCLQVATKSHETEAKITVPENKNVNLIVTNTEDIDERLKRLAEKRNARKAAVDP